MTDEKIARIIAEGGSGMGDREFWQLMRLVLGPIIREEKKDD